MPLSKKGDAMEYTIVVAKMVDFLATL
ncbi:hypothetical protein Gohar_019459 [Gossypium harknessii]|uniref:Uncharacterized protein n=1 Tax=Gossypium harknessii TaxID=34285 RepID=A0A7J9IF84_9ROSI|nr:hypothetical protein [Gossypium harknessii]